MTSSHHLLLGAGFSRNWGGWLANEVFEALIGDPKVRAHEDVLEELWKQHAHPGGGGYEAALAIFESKYEHNRSSMQQAKLEDLQSCVLSLIREMDSNLVVGVNELNFSSNISFCLKRFLARFDSIFTLNQDTLVERHYVNSEAVWQEPTSTKDTVIMPGVSTTPNSPNDFGQVRTGNADPVPPKSQPFYKLHGSWNWRDAEGHPVFITGGGKSPKIAKNELLNSYQTAFRESMNAKGAKLMIIGYGFGDPHINTVIRNAITQYSLEIFLIDPGGAETLLRAKNTQNRTVFEKALVGASRRSLSQIFGSDSVELSKVLRFFSND